MSNEWYTPPEFIKSVHDVLGRIDLDPASCERANKTVKADRIYTKDENGLMHPWFGHIFCNPPYGKTDHGGASYLEAFTRKLIEEYILHHVTKAILLIPANTATSWFDLLWQFPICFPKSRIRFIQENGQPSNGVSFGTCLVYFGHDENRFVGVFGKYGHVALPTPTCITRPIMRELWEAS